ncbi:MAG: CocE/NonD family hydrolase [Halobacteriota archaeon]
MSRTKSEVRDGMRIDWDVPIEMDDGVVLRADVYRPPDDGEYPVIMTYGPYGKYLTFQRGYPDQWERMADEHPDVPAGSSNKYQNWEVVDPEKWVPDGYAVVRVDSRGAGRSPGHLDVWSRRETEDFAQCIEWGGVQPWSNGKVGLNGISYYAMNQWQVASLQPDHLEAICAWEGAADWYRDLAYHGGIYCTFAQEWYQNQVETVQHGVGENGFRSDMNGEWVAGPETLTEEELGANRADLREDMISAPLATDEYWQQRKPDWSQVEVPLLSASNWGGQGLHPRGNYEGYERSASDEKYLEVHGIEHWTEFYTDYGVDIQKRFFGHYLKGEDTGWDEQPEVQLQVRHPGEEFEERHEEAWPIPRTDWTRYYLHPEDSMLSTDAPDSEGSVTYDALGDGVTFLTPPLSEETEVTGPISSKLFVSSDTEDADLFLVVRVFTPDMEEVVFMGALDPHTPIAQGWLRASHRKLDEDLSREFQPYHTHDEEQPLEPGEIYELDVEIWPTSIVVPEGYRIGLSVRGTDYEYPGEVDTGLESMEGVFTGVGPFRHKDATDRPVDVYGGDVTIHTGPDYPSSVLLPIIPDRD